MEQKLARKLNKAWGFLGSHPAFDVGVFDTGNTFTWGLLAVCKRGHSEDSRNWISVYYDDKKRKGRWEKEFLKDYTKEALIDHPELCSVHKTYKEIYGKLWVFDHTEYWYEMSFFVYQGRVKQDDKKWYLRERWFSYAGPEGYAATFEELIIKAAQHVKKDFGDFSNYDEKLFTEEEKVRKKNVKEPWKFTPTGEIWIDPITGKDGGLSELSWDPNWVQLDHHVLNRRWLHWFVSTPYCKEHWEGEFEPVLEGKYGKYEREHMLSDYPPDTLFEKFVCAVKEQMRIALVPFRRRRRRWRLKKKGMLKETKKST